MQFQEEKAFKDPVHDYIYVKDDLIWRLINTSAFQRLRRIRQMGTSYLTFHGAEHSRFTHSLGTYETMRKILSHFERNYQFHLDERTRFLALCAALLHDIGHGPFSHAMEAVFDLRHESWTLRIIEEDHELRSIFDRIDSSFAEDLQHVIRKGERYPLVTHLISSQLDCDRMDYLLRDALHAGVIYGKFELERLIRVMIPAEDAVYVKQTGLHTVEQYILARYFMYSQVYLHPVTIGCDVLLHKVVSRARELFQNGRLVSLPSRLTPLMIGNRMPVEEYLKIDEAVLLYAIAEWQCEPDSILADLSRRFIDRRLFKYLKCGPLDEEQLDTLRHRLREQGVDPDYYLEYRKVTTAGYLYREGISVLLDSGRIEEISRQSPLIQSLVEPAAAYYIYFPEETVDGEKLLMALMVNDDTAN